MTNTSSSRPIVWCIAGSDSGGGAGITADVRTVSDLGCHPCAVVTAITAQNSQAINAVSAVSNAMLLDQLDTLLSDMPPAAIKIGLLANQAQLECLASWLAQHVSHVPLVLDPVLCATSGSDFGRGPLDFSPLLALTTVFTPNVAEVAALIDQQCDSFADLITALPQIAALTDAHLLLKGGDLQQSASAEDLLYLRQPAFCAEQHANQAYRLCSTRVATRNNHGTGCMLSSAIAAFIAQAWVIPDAIVLAKAYVHHGLVQSYAVGGGAGSPSHSGFPQRFSNFPQVIPLHSACIKRSQQRQFAFVSPIYPVVSSYEQLAELLQAGCLTVQLRLKTSNHSLLESTIQQAIALAKRYHAQLFINDHWQLALKYHAYGVHLGQEDVAQADLVAIRAVGIVVGLSSHSFFEALIALNYQPDYLALGHIFATTTKVMPSLPQGLNRLQHYANVLADVVPTVAIGGINISNLAKVHATGVQAAAVVRAVTEADNIAAAYRYLQQLWQQKLPALEVCHD
ncbi:thiamine phosphate synthase [Shewanella sp.]|uniref:thiamine phosphate synthase n=1 Tax=Shewanella sp. TaxID=50422 RepID=UPI003A975F9F